MAKTRRTSGQHATGRSKGPKPVGPERSPIAAIPSKYHTAIYIGLILLALLIFFGGVIFSGDVFTSSDNTSWKSFGPYLEMMSDKGEPPLWMPYIFSGMPSFAGYLVTGDRWWDLTMKIFYSSEHVFGFTNYEVMRVIMHYFIFGIGMFLLMRTKKATRSISFFVALAAMFSTWIIIYIMIGHNTKIMTLMALPYVFIFLERLVKKWSLLYAGLLILAIHVLAEAGHLQTAFYAGCAVGIYLLVELISSLMAKEKDVTLGVVRAGLIALVGVGFAYGMGLDRNLAVQEYLPYSTRGAAAITADDAQQGEAALDVGHGYEYATEWSFSPGEMVTFVVPSYYGFGKTELEELGQTAMVYWGQMRFTDAAHYMGIAVLILGLFGAWMNKKNRFVQAMIGVGLFGLILSFGSNLPILYDMFYNLVPGFSKFRAPSQSLVLLEFAFPILAGYGIMSLVNLRKAGHNPQVEKTFLYTAIAFAVFMFIGIAGQAVIKSGYVNAIEESGKLGNNPVVFDAVYNMMITDWMFSGFFGLATLLLMWLYVRRRITTAMLKLTLIGILLFDLWRIDVRPMETEPKEKMMAVFQTTDVDMFLAQDSSQYRILNVATGPNYPAYHFQQHILGYSSAKMRRYQDLLDVAGNGNVPTSELAWDLLNTKYVIGQQPISENMHPVFQSKQQQLAVFERPTVMPRAWFVDKVEVAEDLDVLHKIRDNAFNPREVAYVAEPLDVQIDPIQAPIGSNVPVADTLEAVDSATTLAPDALTRLRTVSPATSANRVRITNYEPLHITIEAEASGTNFLVISEMHYPPGWHAMIDGQPAEVIRTNYLLRGIVVPDGKHTIQLDYISEDFETGKWASLILNLVTFACIGVGLFMERRKKDDTPHEESHNDDETVSA